MEFRLAELKKFIEAKIEDLKKASGKKYRQDLAISQLEDILAEIERLSQMGSNHFEH